MEISFYSQLDPNKLITTQFCTWHKNPSAVACVKIGLVSSDKWLNYSKTNIEFAQDPVVTEPQMNLLYIETS